MQNSKIIRLLKGLDVQEFRLLRKYLQSPFFNYSSAMIGLYEYLRKYYPAFDAYQLDRERVFAKVYPGEKYQDKKMRNLLHEFLIHVERFLIQLHLREEEDLAKKLLVASLAKRNNYEAFESKNRALITELEARPYRDTQTFADLLSLYEQYYFHPATDKLLAGENALQAMLMHLDHYFMAGKLRLANEAAAREKVVRQKLPIYFIEEILAKLDQQEAVEHILSFYTLLYRLNESGEAALFFALKKQLLEPMVQLSFKDRQEGLLQLLNYAIRNGNKGQDAFFHEAFDLYWFGIEEKLLFENEKLTDSTFTNIAFLGGKIGALEKVDLFIKVYAEYLEDHIRMDAEALAKAYLYYKKKEFEKVDELIGNFKFNSTFYQLRARSILIRALFELSLEDESFFETLNSRMQAFDKYLRRSREISLQQRNVYLGFLKFLKAILRHKLNFGTEKEKIQLKAKIVESTEVGNKEWLLEQLST